MIRTEQLNALTDFLESITQGFYDTDWLLKNISLEINEKQGLVKIEIKNIDSLDLRDLSV